MLSLRDCENLGEQSARVVRRIQKARVQAESIDPKGGTVRSFTLHKAPLLGTTIPGLGKILRNSWKRIRESQSDPRSRNLRPRTDPQWRYLTIEPSQSPSRTAKSMEFCLERERRVRSRV